MAGENRVTGPFLSRRRFLIVWLGGLLAFGVAIWLHQPLAVEGVPDGIMAHQRAGSAERVDEIHRAWSAADVYRTAFTAMVSDLAFIAIYTLGSLLGGFYFLTGGAGSLRTLGALLVFAALVFGATDFTETWLQLDQLMAGAGDDRQAAIAAAMYWPKVGSFLACLLLPVIGLVLERRTA